jgi:proteasome accessory factor A
MINSRNEPLCGTVPWGSLPKNDPTSHLARLHVIFYDNNLCHTASLLKVGVMQIILAMIEAGRMNPQLILDNPLQALGQWSRDPSLQSRARLVSGRNVTALELQLAFLDEARRFVQSGACADIVPSAAEIIELWDETLQLLRTRQYTALTRRLDWILKRAIMEQALQQTPSLTWTSPEIKHLDHLYSNLDPQDGLYWAYERSGLVDRLVSQARIQHFQEAAPPDTRAWTRALLLQLAHPDDVDLIDWDRIRFKFAQGDSPYSTRCRTLSLANPLTFTQAHIQSNLPESGTLDELLTALGADEEAGDTNPAHPVTEASVSSHGFSVVSVHSNSTPSKT